jgi:hypothetical protein
MSELDPVPSCTVRIHRLDAALAELHLRFADVPADVKIAGRLMGPRCPGVSTIEVAYHLRPLPESGSVYRVLIPEPIFWSEDRPCVYAGPIEFRRDGKTIATITVSVGVRQSDA